MILGRRALGRRRTSLAVASTNAQTAAATTYTFSAQSLGTMVDRRHILVGASGGQSSASKSITGITIDGSAMSQIFSDVSTAGQDPVALFSLPWPVGSTANIAVTFNASMARCGIIVYAMSADYNPASNIFDDQVDKALSGSVLSVDVGLPADGVGLALAMETTSAGTPAIAWTGFTEDAEIDAGASSQKLGSASLPVLSPQTVTVTATFSGTLVTNRCFLRAVSFR